MPITYTCAICNEKFQSLVLDRKQAIAEVGSNLMKHIQKTHTKEVNEVNQDTAKASMLIASLISFNRFILLEEDDLQSQDEMEKVQEQLLELLGFKAEDEEENVSKSSKPDNLIVMPKP